MSLRIGVLLVAFLLVQVDAFSQKSNDGFFYDTLVVMDYTTDEASERLTRMRKPLKRTFYLKSSTTDYTLFKGNQASLTADQVLEILDSGFGLYFDKQEYQGHKNLKPNVLEVMSPDNEVLETIESLGEVKPAVIKKKLKIGAKLRFSGFIVSVNEEKLGPILMDVTIIE